MSRYKESNDNLRSENVTLLRIIYGLIGVTLFAIYGWSRAPERLTIDYPPSLQAGGSLRPGEHLPPNIYAFAINIWQQVNRWAENGEKDYGPAIYRMSPYLTPACQEWLKSDLNVKANNGELNMRTRGIQEMQGVSYTEDRVETLQRDQVWRVLADLQISESSRGLPVKEVYVRYPLHVIRYEVDRNANPWGLALDCTGGEDSQRINPPPKPSTADQKTEERSLKIRSASDVLGTGDQPTPSPAIDPEKTPPKTLQQSLFGGKKP